MKINKAVTMNPFTNPTNAPKVLSAIGSSSGSSDWYIAKSNRKPINRDNKTNRIKNTHKDIIWLWCDSMFVIFILSSIRLDKTKLTVRLNVVFIVLMNLFFNPKSTNITNIGRIIISKGQKFIA